MARCGCAKDVFQTPRAQFMFSRMVQAHRKIPQIVLVSGAPGAGKTTLAIPLAAELGFPLFSKDFIKETLVDELGAAQGSMENNRKIGSAAMELIWSLARHAPFAVLEANFRPKNAYEIGKIRRLRANLVEVHCHCGPEETARRFKARAASPQHHAAHPMKELTADLLKEYDRPLNVGPLLEVDTKHPVDTIELAQNVRAAFGRF